MSNAPNQPVVGVSWYEALAYCRWLSKRNGLRVSLPSEQEWEKAARGTDGRLYPWGNETPTAELCNFANKVGRPTPVGQYSSQGDSPYGCADMAGNVYEWCTTKWPDSYDNYRNDNGLDGTDVRVIRGGAFFNTVRGVRCAFRHYIYPQLRNDYVGFRVIVAPG